MNNNSKKEIFALWMKTSKDGKQKYFSGVLGEGEAKSYLKGFYNLKKKNMKEPDLRVYEENKDGELSENPIVSFWCNASKKGTKYLSGKIGDKRVIAFINHNAKEKQPYISAFWSDDSKGKKDAPKSSKEAPKQERFEEIDEADLPF